MAYLLARRNAMDRTTNLGGVPILAPKRNYVPRAEHSDSLGSRARSNLIRAVKSGETDPFRRDHLGSDLFASRCGIDRTSVYREERSDEKGAALRPRIRLRARALSSLAHNGK